MSLTHYVWIYGLAEALVVSLILTILFGIKWWKLYRDRQQLEFTCKVIAGVLKDEVKRLSEKSTTGSQSRRHQIACLKALVVPFRKDRINQEEVWKEALSHLHECFEDRYEPSHPPSDPHHQSNQLISERDEPQDSEEVEASSFAEPTEIESGIDTLLALYQNGQATIEANREATTDLKRKFLQYKQANQALRSQLESIIQQDEGGALKQVLENYETSNFAFMQAISAKERNYNILVKEFEGLQEHIHNLHVTIGHYRKSVHKLSLERSRLTEENKQLHQQQEVTNSLVARLNRNYEMLRIEYTKLFETTR